MIGLMPLSVSNISADKSLDILARKVLSLDIFLLDVLLTQGDILIFLIQKQKISNWYLLVLI